MQTPLLITLALPTVLNFALILVRTSCILIALPIFGDHAVPVRIRVAMSIALAMVLTPLLGNHLNAIPEDALALGGYILIEVLIGAIIGFSARLMFDALTMAASVVGFQMGFGTADLIVGDTSTQMNSFTALQRVLVILIFLSLNLHHMFIIAITESFQIVPPGMELPSLGKAAALVTAFSASIFPIALKLAAPVLVALLFTMALMGLMARAVPQMNVFTMSFPSSFFLGMIVYAATMAFYPGWLKEHYNAGVQNIFSVISSLRGT